MHTFIIPFKKTNLSYVIISYKQDDYVILERTVTSFANHVDENNVLDEAKSEVSIQLTQEESLLFADRRDFTIQLNVYSDSGSRHASCEIKASSGVQHHRQVMSGVNNDG